MEEQATKVAEVIITNNNLLLVHFSGHNNDQLVLKQWEGVPNRIMPSSNTIGTLMIRRQRRQREHRKTNRFDNQSGISLNSRTGPDLVTRHYSTNEKERLCLSKHRPSFFIYKSLTERI